MEISNSSLLEKLRATAERFDIRATVIDIRPLGNGLINDTLFVATEGDAPNYVLQRINHNIFTDVELLQRNIEVATDHIRRQLTQQGCEDIDRRVLQFIPEITTGKTYLADEDGCYWRMSRFIERSTTLEDINPDTSRRAGVAFGDFQRMLSDLSSDLGETIPNFHNMEFRLAQLQEAVKNDKAGRVAETSGIVAKLLSKAEAMTAPERLYREGKLPKRICHCDTKVNNMLFDEHDNFLCVIDLDTVMPSFVFSDFGDFLRTAACSTPEDEPDLSKIDFKMEIFKAFTEGYLSSAGAFLTKTELDWLPDSVALFPYMQATRFLTDYLNGDTYYKISYPTHNLIRTKAQLRLLEKIEEAMPEIRSFINSHESI